MDHESPELIEREMQDTRQSLTDKVAALETQVVGTIQSATTAVQDTVDSVKEAMHDTVASVKDTVQESVDSVSEAVKSGLDVRHHVAERPWGMVGGATALGFIAGLLVCPSRSRGVSARGVETARPSYAPAAAAPSGRPGLFDELIKMVGAEIRKLGETAVSTASASLKQTLNEGIPKLLETALSTKHEQNGDAHDEANVHHVNSAFHQVQR